MIKTLHQWQRGFAEDDVHLCAKAVADHTLDLTESELEVIASSVTIRKQTYSTGRFCAKDALKNIGIDRRDYIDGLLRQEDGSVAWPSGAIGSISHTNDWAVAAVAQSGKQVESLGVDIEKIDRVEKDVLRMIATDAERAILESAYHLRWGRVALFSIKESLYKCLRPVYGNFIGFKDVQVENLNAPLIGKSSVAAPKTEATSTESVRVNKTENLPEVFCPSIKLLLPALAECCDEKRIHVRLAILPSHVLSLVTYHSATYSP